jgi:hypothetical protein
MIVVRWLVAYRVALCSSYWYQQSGSVTFSYWNDRQMDLITQTQNYVQTLSSLLAHATEHITMASPSLSTSAGAVSLPDGASLTSSPEFELEPIEEKAKMIFKRIVDG